MSVAVIGAGWAGLACAVDLAAAGERPLVLEAARQPGGRARGVAVDGQRLDNGQHLLIGAYTDTLALMRRVGADPDALLTRHRLFVASPELRLALPPLPPPLDVAAGLLLARGAGWGEKFRAVRAMKALEAAGWSAPPEQTVADWLAATGLAGGVLARRLYAPLCLAALNTPLEAASMAVFARVLGDSLGAGARIPGATDYLVAAADLSAVFPGPAAAWIAARGGAVRTSARVKSLVPAVAGWSIELDGAAQETIEARQVVLAVAPQHASALLPDIPAAQATRDLLAGYRYEPIATVYLGLPPGIGLARPIVQIDGPAPGDSPAWVFDRGAAGNPGVLACVISARGPWQALPEAELAQRLLAHVRPYLRAAGQKAPLRDAPPLAWHKRIVEARATFAASAGLGRPAAITLAPGLHLAGDWTWAPWPATLEGAVRSGRRAAAAVLGTARENG
ncbi:hydroxysqualene dehydroxylase HpnE [Oryzomicrobium sp.]|uniref:hydroxysqualene dehydroxylase HpnE n=1 Tax=Oryzomicrobium sp. TaxID=1911578 RepID=UPI0025D62C8F|nr:hydroxysqualene dehydroxylase HpnE [Oryzomicrobium sp.]MCE1244544.1 hydroxysqualene dehydroxylase HpnE [Oryzomicrobium sp.]